MESNNETATATTTTTKDTSITNRTRETCSKEREKDTKENVFEAATARKLVLRVTHIFSSSFFLFYHSICVSLFRIHPAICVARTHTSNSDGSCAKIEIQQHRCSADYEMRNCIKQRNILECHGNQAFVFFLCNLLRTIWCKYEQSSCFCHVKCMCSN